MHPITGLDTKPQRLFYNMKISLIGLLIISLVAVYMTDYDDFFDIQANHRQEPQPRAAGNIDIYLKSYSFKRYQNVLNDNIFFKDFVVTAPPPKVINTQPKPVVQVTMPLEIKGIVVTPVNRMVMLWDKRLNESHVLREQEELNNWVVLSISKQKVILRHESGEQREFILNEEAVTNFNFQR